MSNVETPKTAPVPTSELAVREYIKTVAPSEVVPERWRGKVRDMYAVIKAGEEIGLPPMVSLRWLYLVNGRAGMAAEGMNALARERGHSISGSTTDDKAIAKGRRSDTNDEMTVEFTMSMAERANLTGGPSWRKYPDDMLWARAVSKLCRRLFPDVFGGLAYSREELESVDVEFVELPEPVTDLGTKPVEKREPEPKTAPIEPEELQEAAEAVIEAEPESSDQSMFESMAQDAVKRGRKKSDGNGS